MCNPRRITVVAARQLAEDWQRQVRRAVSRSADVVGEARIREDLAASIGRPTLTALERVLDRSDGWERDGDAYVFRVPNGFVRYLLETRELEIVARLTERLTATGEATQMVEGRLESRIEATGQGTYYDDEWGGRTEVHARVDAARHAEIALEATAQARRRELDAEAERLHGDALSAAAAQRADAELRRRLGERGAELNRSAEDLLSEVGVRARLAFNRALAEAYHDAILAYARVRRAEQIRTSESGGVVEISFEMQV